eukprot:scaffold5907_cov120-Isochrysis_galbana.AAC.22
MRYKRNGQNSGRRQRRGCLRPTMVKCKSNPRDGRCCVIGCAEAIAHQRVWATTGRARPRPEDQRVHPWC